MSLFRGCFGQQVLANRDKGETDTPSPIGITYKSTMTRI
jgi:hypothetical protein